ncbi:Mor transcription activator family protein [Desulfovibrio piger]|uniref:Mor transcription activator family protein n=1 Tax=Desulfovibrio piger TaxID=901 RepID=UPI0026F0A4F2|nr:Mor transcription activator family protein [Desulfovibrio piger]
MWSSSGSPATPPRHTAGSADPVDWDSLLPLLPESVRLLRQVLEDDAALHRLLEHCGGLTLRIPRRFPSEGHLLRALLPESVLRRLLGAYGGTCLYIPRCARLARQVRQRELLGAFSRHTAAGTSSNTEVRFLARRYGITDRRVWQLLKQEAELPDKALPAPVDVLQG